MPISTDKEWLKGRAKYMTGFCLHLQCEGTKPKSFSGKPMPTCEFWNTCPCKCHEELDKMFAMADVPRVMAVTNPEYKPDFGNFVMPEPGERVPEPVTFKGTSLTLSIIDEGNVLPIVPAPEPTPSGRSHRGELEFRVLESVSAWGGEEEHGLCTPKVVAEWIASRYKIPTPSTGAIQAVWDRWERMGIATQAKKPARFTGWTDTFDGSPESLEKLKASAKRSRKRMKSAAVRGYR